MAKPNIHEPWAIDGGSLAIGQQVVGAVPAPDFATPAARRAIGRVMVAAPTMLQVLRRLLPSLISINEDDPYGCEHEIALAVAAIAAAEHGTPLAPAIVEKLGCQMEPSRCEAKAARLIARARDQAPPS